MKKMSKLRKIFNPTMFQGDLEKRQYFEGWYFKLVDASEENLYAFIPGISLDQKNRSSHAFIQMLNGKTGVTSYFEYPLKAFKSTTDKFEVKLDKNYFSSERMVLNIHQAGYNIDGEVRNLGTVPWPRTLVAPGVMGWFSFVPFMECYHGVVSLNHELDGHLSINNSDIDFRGGLGYIEKDWGKSFPSGYIWVQSNHFAKGQTSFMASIAKIPWLGMHFTGFLIVLWYGGQIYRFATYTGAKILKMIIKPEYVKVAVADSKHLLIMDAKKVHTKEMKDQSDTAGVLKSPTKGSMSSRIMESLTSQITLSLYKRNKKGKHLIFKDEGRNAGLEIEASSEDL